MRSCTFVVFFFLRETSYLNVKVTDVTMLIQGNASQASKKPLNKI